MPEQKWTPAIGLRQAGVLTIWRIPIAILLWTLCLIIAAPALNFLTISLPIFAMIVVVAIAPGVGIGYGLSRGIVEKAGFASVVIAVIPVFGSVAAVWVGTEIATAIRPIGYWQVGFASIAAAVWASLWSIRTVLADG